MPVHPAVEVIRAVSIRENGDAVAIPACADMSKSYSSHRLPLPVGSTLKFGRRGE